MSRRVVVSYEDAAIVEGQIVRPCSDCPWRRDSVRGWLGALTAEEWIIEAHGESRIDCHALKYEDGSGDAPQCAGAAIYRANVAKMVRDRSALRLKSDRKHVFSSPREFAEHHGKP